MTDQMLIVFGVLAGAVGLFSWGRPRADIVAILVVLALMLSRVLTPQESLAGFGDPVVILIAAIFIVGEALVNTGVAHRLGEAQPAGGMGGPGGAGGTGGTGGMGGPGGNGNTLGTGTHTNGATGANGEP